MKYICLFFLIVGINFAACGQVYYVFHIKGAIILKKTKKPLKVGDSIQGKDKLVYKTKDAVVYAVNEFGKRYKGNTVYVNEIKTVLETFSPSIGYAGIRETLFPGKAQLQQFFAASDSLISEEKGYVPKPFLIINELKYKVLAEGFEQNTEQYFYIEYVFGGNLHRIKLPFERDNQVIINQDVFKIDNTLIPVDKAENIQVYFHSRQEEVLLGGFLPVFVDEKILKDEMSVFLKYLKTTDKSNKQLLKDDIIPHLQEVYGSVLPSHLKKWLKDNFEFTE